MARPYIGWAQAVGLFIGGLLIVIGAVLPWIHNSFNNPRGLQYFDEGKITFALGWVAIGLGALRASSRWRTLDVAVTVLGSYLSAAVITLAAMKLVDIRSLSEIWSYLPIRVGVGLPVTLAGGSLTALSCLLGLFVELARWRAPVAVRFGSRSAPSEPLSRR